MHDTTTRQKLNAQREKDIAASKAHQAAEVAAAEKYAAAKK